MPKKAKIYYCDIGDYLTREQKLEKIRLSKHFDGLDLVEIHPNEHGDWLTTRDEAFQTFIPMGEDNSFFQKGLHCRGLETARDSWVYNFSKKKLQKNMLLSIDFFNAQSEKYKNTAETTNQNVDFDDSRISWSRSFISDLRSGRKKQFSEKCIQKGIYRPFICENIYFSREQNNVVSRIDSFFPHPSSQNLVICVPGPGGAKGFSSIISNCIPDLELVMHDQCFPLYYYEENKTNAQASLFANKQVERYTRKDGISDFIHQKAIVQYGGDVTKEDIFYYVYGILHSPEYRKRFVDDLKKSLPRLPLVKNKGDFEIFSRAGRALADLHLNYENRKPPKTVYVIGAESGNFHVEKMRFGGKGKEKDKTLIQYNSSIRIENIPLNAYEYIVNGKSAIEWIMERYAISTDKASGIVNDPNDWAIEHNQPRYILDLVLSIITVSIETMRIVHSLPPLEMDKV